MSYSKKKLMHSFLVNIRISQPSEVVFTILGLTNPDVNLKRMHQLYNVLIESCAVFCGPFFIWAAFRCPNPNKPK